MKKTIMVLAAMAFVGSVASVQVVPGENEVKGCERLGETAAGNKFMQLDRATAEKAVREQAEAMNANKVFLSVTSHTHPKLGKQYTAKAVAWKCDK